jgi:hypothetical protein
MAGKRGLASISARRNSSSFGWESCRRQSLKRLSSLPATIRPARGTLTDSRFGAGPTYAWTKRTMSSADRRPSSLKSRRACWKGMDMVGRPCGCCCRLSKRTKEGRRHSGSRVVSEGEKPIQRPQQHRSSKTTRRDDSSSVSLLIHFRSLTWKMPGADPKKQPSRTKQHQQSNRAPPADDDEGCCCCVFVFLASAFQRAHSPWSGCTKKARFR